MAIKHPKAEYPAGPKGLLYNELNISFYEYIVTSVEYLKTAVIVIRYVLDARMVRDKKIKETFLLLHFLYMIKAGITIIMNYYSSLEVKYNQ